MPGPKLLTYDDVIKSKPGTSNEPLVNVSTYDNSIIAQYEKFDMVPFTGLDIYVRDTVARKLHNVQDRLTARHSLGLKIVYGYRNPEVQQKYFNRRRTELATQHPTLGDDALDRLTHNFVAMPDIAGHATGGAVDVTLIDIHGNDLDMGTAIADYTDPEKICTYAANLTQEQARNRQILLEAMRSEGFAPFFGEWWHFSYGDREWAAFYGKEAALYGTQTFRTGVFMADAAGGNRTAISLASQPLPADTYAAAGETLLSSLAAQGVEQVGFLNTDTSVFTMAGGEFCGNATCMAAVLLSSIQGKNSFDMRTSGIDTPVSVHVEKTAKDAYEAVCTIRDLAYKTWQAEVAGKEVSVVDLGGIVHVLLEDVMPSSRKQYTALLQEAVQVLNLGERAAVGLIWHGKTTDGVRIDPLVWVRSVDTCFYESSCGSGSIAAAIVTGANRVTQPTNKDIQINLQEGRIELKTTVQLEQ